MPDYRRWRVAGGVFFYGESAGAAIGYVGAACGGVARGGAGDTGGATVSYRCLGERDYMHCVWTLLDNVLTRARKN